MYGGHHRSLKVGGFILPTTVILDPSVEELKEGSLTTTKNSNCTNDRIIIFPETVETVCRVLSPLLVA